MQIKSQFPSLSAVVLIGSFSLLVACQTKESPQAIQDKIVALDKAGWEAWKNKDANWFRENTLPNFISISESGVSNRDQVIEAALSACDVKSYTLHDVQCTFLTSSSVLLSYTADQVGVCGTDTLAPHIRAVSNYIKQDGRWFEGFYMETHLE